MRAAVGEQSSKVGGFNFSDFLIGLTVLSGGLAAGLIAVRYLFA